MQINDSLFAACVLRSPRPIVVDFWASWCAPCKMMEPMVDRLARRYAGQVDLVKLNIDRNPAAAARCKIESVPAFVLFVQGREVDRRVGAQTENQLRSLIEGGLVGPGESKPPASYVTIVSGLPRSGTSLMMRMLAAGGVAPLTDHQRRPDADNPDGYFEFEAVKGTARDATWLDQASGKVVKMVYRLIADLPGDREYRIVMMRRDMAEIVASQRRMLERAGRPVGGDDSRTQVLLRRDLAQFLSWAERQPHLALAQVNFNDLVTDSADCLARLDKFLDGRIDTGAMSGVIRPELYRNRAS